MLMVCEVRPEKRGEIPAVTHVDGTARVQTVNRSDNPIFWDLINEFKHLTGTPVVLNTSSNVKDEPIVDAQVDAIRCFFQHRPRLPYHGPIPSLQEGHPGRYYLISRRLVSNEKRWLR
jgi:predicted NodU family carbamoyl transferase